MDKKLFEFKQGDDPQELFVVIGEEPSPTPKELREAIESAQFDWLRRVTIARRATFAPVRPYGKQAVRVTYKASASRVEVEAGVERLYGGGKNNNLKLGTHDDPAITADDYLPWGREQLLGADPDPEGDRADKPDDRSQLGGLLDVLAQLASESLNLESLVGMKVKFTVEVDF